MSSFSLALLVAVAIGVVLLNLAILYKLIKVHLCQFKLIALAEATEKECRALYRQIESFQHLMTLLKLENPLPPLRGWAASPDFLLAAAQYALEDKPRTVIECSSGASTLVLARCMQINDHGHVYSLEHDPHYAEQTRSQIKQHALEEWVTVCDAPLEATHDGHKTPWYCLKNLPREARDCGLLVVDGPPKDTGPLARLPALSRLGDRLHRDCVTLLDDADRPDEQTIVQQWLQSDATLEAKSLNCEKGCVVVTREGHNRVSATNRFCT